MTGWHSVHVHYHDEDPAATDDLLLDAVRPVLRGLAGPVPRRYWVRHWRQGPHLRLNFRTDEATFTAAVLPALRADLGAYLAASPSRAETDPAAALPRHRQLAQLEADEGPLQPWYPDNTLHRAPYERRLDVLGSSAAVDLVAGFQVATTELAFAGLDAVRSGTARRSLAFDLMVATAHALSGIGLRGGFVSFRSHAESFLAGKSGAASLREPWDRCYTGLSAELVGRARAVLAALGGDGSGGDGGAVPFVRDWVSALAPIRAEVGTLLREGRMELPTISEEGDAGVWSVSPFHRRIRHSEGFRTALRAEWFGQYRMMINLLYLYLSRLGITPIERYLLGHLVANAAEEIYQVRAAEIVEAAPTGAAS